MEQIVTWFFLILLSLFIYLRILNLNTTGVKKIVGGIVFSGILAYGVFLMRTTMPYSRFISMVLAIGTFAGIMTDTRFDLALTASIISIGISYGFSLVFALISAFILRAFFESTNITVMIVMSFAMQIVLIFLLFRIERFEKGMLFLQKSSAGIIGCIASGTIFVAIILIGNIYFDERLRWQFLVVGILCAVGLILWWRKRLTKLYQEWMRDRKRQECEAIIAERDEQIQALQKSNEAMASLIHRDNKMLPAMYQTMKALYNEESYDIEISIRSKRAMDRIEEYMEERTGIIMRNQRKNKILPSTGDDAVDGIMRYMLLKATGSEISFDLTVIEDMSDLTETIVPTTKFETLCADLIENAIISASHSAYKKVFITLGIDEGFFELNIQDSGIPFEIDTLMSLGIIKASTYLDKGGSGIGYMSVFEILRECNASLIITECEPSQYGFTKSVKVRFDNRNEYFVHTFRSKQLIAAQSKLDEQAKGPTILSI